MARVFGVRRTPAGQRTATPRRPFSTTTAVAYGRAAAGAVVLFASLNWWAWAAGHELLTRLRPDWPQTTPWSAGLLAALGAAILAQSGRPSRKRVWVGRGTAVAVALIALFILTEYLTGQQSGTLDRFWFGEAVGRSPSRWPGRPSLLTAVSVSALAAGVALAPAPRRSIRIVRLVLLTGAVAVPLLALLIYIFSAVAVVQTGPNTGVGIVTAVGLLLLCAATIATQPATRRFGVGKPSIPTRMLVLMVSFPFAIGITRRLLIAGGVDPDTVPVYSTTVGTLLVGAAVLYLSGREEKLLETSEADRALLRATAQSAAVGNCLVDPSGRLLEVNAAVCDFFGYDADTLLGKTWQELTAAEYLQADLGNVADLLAGHIDSYRMEKQYIHADGHPIWGDLSVGCVRDSTGQATLLTAQIVDIDERVRSQRLIAQSEANNRALARGLQNDLDSALRYVRSLLPTDLSGPVRTCSQYLPARSVGGDFYDFFWADDDHLVVYLLDVAGHGVGPALVAVSAQHVIRTITSKEGVLDADRVLTELNRHFCSDGDDQSYLTIWYGVYQRSTASLRYAGGGHPPALLFSAGNRPILLASQAPPVGAFEDSTFSAEVIPISPGDTLLLYSDGLFERGLPNGRLWSFTEFVDTCTRLSGKPGSSCGDLIDSLPPRSGQDGLDDDTTLVRVTFGPKAQFVDRPKNSPAQISTIEAE